MKRSAWLAWIGVMVAVGCGSSVNGGSDPKSSGPAGQGGSTNPPPTSKPPSNPPPNTPPPQPLVPNPNNPEGCPPTLPTIGSVCDEAGWDLACSYVGDTCLEWVTCYTSCYGTSVGVTGTGVGGYGGSYDPGCSTPTWLAAPSEVLPACNPVSCDLANEGDPCADAGTSCGWGDGCTFGTKNCGSNHTWSVDTTSYEGCGGYGQTTGVSVGVGGGFGGGG